MLPFQQIPVHSSGECNLKCVKCSSDFGNILHIDVSESNTFDLTTELSLDPYLQQPTSYSLYDSL